MTSYSVSGDTLLSSLTNEQLEQAYMDDLLTQLCDRGCVPGQGPLVAIWKRSGLSSVFSHITREDMTNG